MFGLHYVKTNPTQFVLHHTRGRLRRSGAGLAFFYYRPTATIAVVPVSSGDVPFIFNEVTADFQAVSVQGQLTYRIADPLRVASLLNYAVEGRTGRYVSDDVEKLPQRLVNLVQAATRAEVQGRTLREAIQSSQVIAAAVQARLAGSAALGELGVEVLALSITAVKPNPEMARALEAGSREALLRQADDAVYVRRNAAVEQERRIKENELNTEVAVEGKRCQIREAKLAADLAAEEQEQHIREVQQQGAVRLEQERRQLVAVRAENARAEADSQAYAVSAALQPLRQLDPATLQTLALQSADPRLLVSMALREIAQNAARIGQLNISPDLLETLITK